MTQGFVITGHLPNSLENPPYAVHRPPDRLASPHYNHPSSISRSAVRRPHSFIRSPIRWRYSSDGLESPSYNRPSSTPRSAVRRPRSIFVYSFPCSLTVLLRWAGKPVLQPPIVHSAVCRPPSAVYIRLVVPLFVDGTPPMGWKARPTAVCRPPSAVCSQTTLLAL